MNQNKTVMSMKEQIEELKKGYSYVQTLSKMAIEEIKLLKDKGVIVG